MNLDIQVGDRVTYLDSYKTKRITIIKDAEMVETFKIDTGLYIEILKIERPQYEVIEEKKELLTEEEKEYLKLVLKLEINKTIAIKKTRNSAGNMHLNLLYGNGIADGYYRAIKDDYFKNLEKNVIYTLKELGLKDE